MSRHRETNPHFHPQQTQPQHSPPNLPLPTHQQPQTQPWSEHDPNTHFPLNQHPQYQHEHPRSPHGRNVPLPAHQQPQHHTRPWSEHDPNTHFPLHPHPQYQHEHPRPQKQKQKRKKPPPGSPRDTIIPVPVPAHQQPQHQKHPAGQQPQHQKHPAGQQPQHVPIAPVPLPQHSTDHLTPTPNQPYLRGPQPRKTKPFAWFIAVFCALFWIIIIVGGLIILIVYLLFRPKSPKFDVSTATLNAAYLDTGYLLNADITLLANFSNPNKKVRVDFGHMVINLYYENIPIATRYIAPFTVRDKGSKFADVHMVISQVPLSLLHSQQLRKNMESNRVKFEIMGRFRTRSSLGGFLRYSYWLYGHCTIVMTSPPGGVMIAKSCRTKR